MDNKENNFNTKQRQYLLQMYVGDCIRDLTKVMKNINTNLEKIANNTRKVEISSVYQNCGPVKLTPKYEGKFYKEGYVDKNIILD